MSRETNSSGFNRILVAVDGSAFSERAGFHAANLAQKYSATLIVLHVAKYPANSLGITSTHTVSVGLPLSDPVVDRMKEGALDSMKKISGYARRLGIIVDEQIVDTSSSIVETIVDFAYHNNVDLIVVGSRGLNTFRATLTGSVSEGILREARCTVMIVR